MKTKFNKTIIGLFSLVLTLFQVNVNSQTKPEDPRFTMIVRNIHTTDPQNTGRDSILRFEIWLQQINQGQSGVNDFEYCAAQFTWSYNKAVQGNGNLTFGIYGPGCELPPSLRPPSFQVDSVNGYLKMSGNLPNSLANFFIKGSYPGTKILTAQLKTSLSRFPDVPLNLRFKLGASPNTFVAYFLPYPDSVDSEQFPAQFAVALMDTINPGPPATPVYHVYGDSIVIGINNEISVGIPSVYSISQNYPNPFNPTTTINYELPYAGKVSILVYDISGREIAKLVNEVKTAGYHSVKFNGSNFASGMYLYRITAEGNNQNFVTTKKMLLIK